MAVGWRATVKSWMLDNAHLFIDCGELQCTQLAEAAASEFAHEDWLNDSDHWVWEIPIQIASRVEKKANKA